MRFNQPILRIGTAHLSIYKSPGRISLALVHFHDDLRGERQLPKFFLGFSSLNLLSSGEYVVLDLLVSEKLLICGIPSHKTQAGIEFSQ